MENRKLFLLEIKNILPLLLELFCDFYELDEVVFFCVNFCSKFLDQISIDS